MTTTWCNGCAPRRRFSACRGDATPAVTNGLRVLRWRGLLGGRGQHPHHLLHTTGDALVAALKLRERARHRIRDGAALDRGGIEIPKQHDVPWVSSEASAHRAPLRLVHHYDEPRAPHQIGMNG